MKKLIAVFALVLSVNAWSLSFADMAGIYSVNPVQNIGLNIENIIRLYPNGDIEMTERSIRGELYCEGQAKWQGETIVSTLFCENDEAFTQEVTLIERPNSSGNFQADVYSSLYNMTLRMNFEKLQ